MHLAPTLKGNPEVDPRIRMPGHQSACPIKLFCGLVELTSAQMQHPEVVVRGAVIQIRYQRITKKTLCLNRILIEQINRLGSEFDRKLRVAYTVCIRTRSRLC